MNWMTKAAVSLVLTFAGASSAFAMGTSNGVLLNLNAYMYDVESQSGGNSSGKSSTSIYDLKLGYLTGSGLYLGGIYTSRSVSGTDSYSGNAMGASIGYVGSSGFFIQGHYLLSGEYNSMKEGSGYQGDFGYLTNVTAHFMVGVELTHRNMTYKDVPGSSDSVTIIETFPMLTVGFVF